MAKRGSVPYFQKKAREILGTDSPASVSPTPVNATAENDTNRPQEVKDTGVIRQFPTGATRDSEAGKLDFEGFFSPFALEAYAHYMNKHRVQSDGSLRDSDNWQKGFGPNVTIKSAFRHYFAWWKIHRGGQVIDERDGHVVTKIEAICGMLFNGFAELHEITKPVAEKTL